MSTQVKHRRGSQSEVDNFTPAVGEIVVSTTENELVLGDGVKQGGYPIPKKSSVVLSFQLIIDAIESTSAKVNYVANIKETTSNTGDSDDWDYILKGTTPDVDLPNGDNIRACTGVTTLAIKRRDYGQVGGELKRKYTFVGGVERNSGSGWFVINDPNHRNTNIADVNANPSGTLQIDYKKEYSKIVALLAGPDEELVKKGVAVGGSVGKANALFDLASPFSFHVDASSGAVTIDALFAPYITTDATSPIQLVINHPNMVGAPTITPVGSSGRSRGRVSYSATQTVIQEVCPIGGYFQFNGASWDYIGDMLVPPTAVFAAGVLTITHPAAFDNVNVQLTGRDEFAARAGSSGTTTTAVKFYDAANVQMMAANTNMKVHFQRNGEVQAKSVGGLYAVKLGVCKLDANDFVSTSGNVWNLGIFED